MRFTSPAASLLLLFVWGCSSDSSDAPSGATGSPGGTGTAATTGAGGGTATGTGAGAGPGSGGGGAGPIGGDRPVTVYVPDSYDPATPAPLVILLHGYTATGALQEAYFGLKAESDARGFLYAYPDGTVDGSGENFWNATDACCNFYGSSVDDSAYLRLVIDDIKAAFNVDAKRVFFVGHSNGGFMSHRMACDHADAVAAFASLAGSNWNDLADCTPSEPVAALQIHGTADETVAYGGGLFGANAFPSATASVESWATLDGCSLTATAGANLDLEDGLAGAETTVTLYADGCNPGGHAELWTIEAGTHIPVLSDAFAPSIMDFLFAHPKP